MSETERAPHWSMEPNADKLRIEVQENWGGCLCDEGKIHVKGDWPIHGWAFHAGQCCECINIRVFHNGTQPSDFDSGDEARIEYADAHSDEIHICDLPEFIEMLQAIQAAQVRKDAA